MTLAKVGRRREPTPAGSSGTFRDWCRQCPAECQLHIAIELVRASSPAQAQAALPAAVLGQGFAFGSTESGVPDAGSKE